MPYYHSDVVNSSMGIHTYADSGGQFHSHGGDITWHEQWLQNILTKSQTDDRQRCRPTGHNTNVLIFIILSVYISAMSVINMLKRKREKAVMNPVHTLPARLQTLQ